MRQTFKNKFEIWNFKDRKILKPDSRSAWNLDPGKLDSGVYPIMLIDYHLWF
jgi:hypothetical protein